MLSILTGKSLLVAGPGFDCHSDTQRIADLYQNISSLSKYLQQQNQKSIQLKHIIIIKQRVTENFTYLSSGS